MLQGLGFAVKAMLGPFLFLQTRNSVTTIPASTGLDVRSVVSSNHSTEPHVSLAKCLCGMRRMFLFGFSFVVTIRNNSWSTCCIIVVCAYRQSLM
jgi:hypothetical protein